MLRDLAELLCGALLLVVPLVMFLGWYGAKDRVKRRRLAKLAETRAMVIRARTLAAPVYTASAKVLTPEEISDQELEGTRQIRVDILGSWIPPEELDEDAPLYERVRRARPFVHQTAIGPGWVLVTKPEPQRAEACDCGHHPTENRAILRACTPTPAEAVSPDA